jgi:NAD(P)-dependent dehydrogenase (short-subunit alcohol dehydrogenase family)
MSVPSNPGGARGGKTGFMTNQQHPIGTGFGAASTAEEVLRGIDLGGKNVIVTGGHSGLGLETTRMLARAGASVTVGARDPERAAAAVAGMERVQVGKLDLADPASVAAFADAWLASGRPLHILINNATAAVSPELGRDARGLELQFATGHLGHFQLTTQLHVALRAARGARVVNVSSGAHRIGQIRWDDPGFANAADYSARAAYGQVKKANVLFTVELDRRWKSEGIRSYAVHPGVIIHKPLTPERRKSYQDQGLLDEAGAPIIDPEAGKKTMAQGVSTIVFAATSPQLADVGGVYLKDNDVSRIDDEVRQLTAETIPSEITSASIDPEAAERLWELSETLLARA